MSRNRQFNRMLSDAAEQDDNTTVIETTDSSVTAVIDEPVSPPVEETAYVPLETTYTTTPEGDIQGDLSVNEVITDAKAIIDNTGTQVIKPNLNTRVPSGMIQSSVKTATTSDEDVSASQLKKLIDVYVEFNNGDIMRTKDDTERASTLFVSVLKFVLERPTIPVLDVLYRFFSSNRDKILAPEYVQIGISRSLDKREAERLICLYTMFRMMTGQSKGINISMLRVMLGSLDPSKIDMLIMYYDQKIKRG